MMRLAELEAMWPKISAVCGAAIGAAGTALTFLGEAAMSLLGVPLPVVLVAAAGAGWARAVKESQGFWPALFFTSVWTIIGCGCAPFVQWAAPILLKAALDMDIAVPGQAMAFIAGAVSSSTWWGPKVWPLIVARFPALGGAKAKEGGENA